MLPQLKILYKYQQYQGGTTYKHSITSAASQTTTDTFNGTLTFINLGTDQQQNTNKTFAASLQMTRVACS
jgi:hypothetical protein